MDEASHFLEDIMFIQQKLPIGYHRFSLNPSLVEEVVNPTLSSVNPTLPLESDLPLVDEVVNPIISSFNPVQEGTSLLLQDSVVSPEKPLVSFQESIIEQSLVDLVTLSLNPVKEVIKPTPFLVDPTLPIESDSKIVDVFLVSLDFFGHGDISSHTMVPPLSFEVCSFDWNSLTKPHLPSNIHFQISVGVAGKEIFRTNVDEGAYVIILSLIAWKYIGSPQLVPTTEKILAFNRIPTKPLGILP